MNVEHNDAVFEIENNSTNMRSPKPLPLLRKFEKSQPLPEEDDCEQPENPSLRRARSTDDDKKLLKSKIRSLSAIGVFSQIHKCEDQWKEKVNNFKVKTEEKEKSEKTQKKRSILTMGSAERRRAIKALVRDSYRRHHPRRVILDFFNDVAREGAHNVEETGKIKSLECLHPMLRYFNRASVFTVWRPTSMDAMIKMIRCEAVGKGLGIKAKSSIQGKLSGYVPFLQISKNGLKKLIDTSIITKNGVVRLYFQQGEKEEGEMARAKALATLEQIRDEILNMKNLGELMLAFSNAVTDEEQVNVLEEINHLNKLSQQMRGYSIKLIDDYAPSSFGLEIPMILFWEAFIVRQDISCEPGSTYDTGRKSSTKNQNLNVSAALYDSQRPKVADGHRTVLVQNGGLDSPLNPFELLMAYEIDDKSKVLPVVSDCDCFLVGTRRVTYHTPMDPEQVDIMKWNVSEIEKILQKPAIGLDWGDRWNLVLNHAKEEGKEIKIPEIGFGDPKSCSIMKNAVDRLVGSGSGGVRHGAECFNYVCPQDTGDSFIIIADGLPEDKPWIQVNLEELHDYLDEKISLSFTFPIHPKWMLYDGGRWKEHYDKLMAFDNENTQDSMNVWYPKESGVREQIEQIFSRHHGPLSNTRARGPLDRVSDHVRDVSKSPRKKKPSIGIPKSPTKKKPSIGAKPMAPAAWNRPKNSSAAISTFQSARTA